MDLPTPVVESRGNRNPSLCESVTLIVMSVTFTMDTLAQGGGKLVVSCSHWLKMPACACVFTSAASANTYVQPRT